MAICRWCEQEMRTASSCTVDALHDHGSPIALIPWGRERGWRGQMARSGKRCGDCGVRPLGFHHPGCDLQQCPRCRGQLLSCGCWFDEDAPDDDEALEGWAGFLPIGGVVDCYVDADGVLTERVSLGGEEVVVHYDDIPEKDITTVDGLRCTTALRTIIDIASDLAVGDLRRAVDDCLARGLFTVEEAFARLSEDDMRSRRGAQLLDEVLRRHR